MTFDEAPTLEPEVPSTQEVPSDAARSLGDAERTAITGTYDALKRNVPGFRTRRAQAHMIGACARALGNDGGAAIVEAGTGTGKSLAYLTTGMTLAQMHQKTLLIATGTVGLQEQLTTRDIPMFSAATKVEGTPVLAKGRNRYACPRNMEILSGNSGAQESLRLGMDDDLSDAAAWPRAPRKGEAERVQKLFERLEGGSWDGDLDNPPLRVDDQLRPLLTTSSGGCAGRKCAFYHRCPYFTARKQLEDATVIVANHALLLSDLQFDGDKEGTYGGVLLPELQNCLVVVDEGHQLSHSAISASAGSAHLSSIMRRAQKWPGYIQACYRATGKEKIAKTEVHDAVRMVQNLVASLKALSTEIQSTWTPDPRDGEFAQYRAPMGVLPESWRDRAGAAQDWVKELRRVISGAKRALGDAELDAGAKAVLPREIGMIHERLEDLGSVLYWWSQEVPSDQTAPPVARWVRLASAADHSLVLCASPVTASGFIRDRIFGQAAGVVVTSATLSAGGDFSKVARDLGLPKHGEVMSLQSPFNYEEQAVLQVPWIRAAAKDLEAHSREIADWMMRELDPTAGNLVLFNSKAKLNRVLELLQGPIKAVARSQHEMPKAELLAAHAEAVRAGTGSTLLGTLALGEGVDLPGDLCTTLVVTALPFRPPTDPVEATYCEWLESRGLRPFDEVTVPNAIRVLTQYVGRLLRHEDDRGRVVVLDRRIVETRYGRRILDALPPFRREIARSP